MRKLKRCIKEAQDYYFIAVFYFKKRIMMREIEKAVKRDNQRTVVND